MKYFKLSLAALLMVFAVIDIDAYLRSGRFLFMMVGTWNAFWSFALYVDALKPKDENEKT